VEQKTEQTKDKVEQKAEQAKDKTKSTTESAKTGVSDSWITAKTKIALYADERVSGTQVNVDTKSGVVTLRGKVDSAEAKSAAESVAKSIDGARSVKNELQVVAPPARKAVDASDKDIAKAVGDRLHKDPQLKKVDVRADSGVVTLTGEVSSVTASAKASEIARQIPGVRSVRNEVAFDRKGEARDELRAERTRMGDGRTVWNGSARSAEVRAMQEALKERGYDPGAIDGVMGPRTASALREYQRTENLRVTGQMDAETVSSLKAPAKRQAR
jgi:osmotically-inducible protein OsmY